MNRPNHCVAAQRGDDALDLTPVAETHDIAGIAAALGADCRLKPRVIAKTIEQVGGIGQSVTRMNEGRVHRQSLNPAAVSTLPTKIVNRLLTMLRTIALESGRGVWQWARMVQPNPLAGGCFLTLFILCGFVVGLAIGNPMKGVLGGTAIGAALATGLWLLDRRRRG